MHHVAKRNLALAVTGALIASGLLASSALAAPTGSITIGPRTSTGQLTAQFYSTSDLYDPTHGYGTPWFPHATLAAPGRQCIAGSSIKYIGEIVYGPGSQRSGNEAFLADAGTLCLWVSTSDNDYLVATADTSGEQAAPPKPTPDPVPAPAPAATPAPVLTPAPALTPAPVAAQTPPPMTNTIAAGQAPQLDLRRPLSVFNARSAALAKAKQLWNARHPKVISVQRVGSSKITCRVMWRTKAGKTHTRTVKVKRTSRLGVIASAA